MAVSKVVAGGEAHFFTSSKSFSPSSLSQNADELNFEFFCPPEILSSVRDSTRDEDWENASRPRSGAASWKS
jgi:hypothetical protein